MCGARHHTQPRDLSWEALVIIGSWIVCVRTSWGISLLGSDRAGEQRKGGERGCDVTCSQWAWKAGEQKLSYSARASLPGLWGLFVLYLQYIVRWGRDSLCTVSSTKGALIRSRHAPEGGRRKCVMCSEGGEETPHGVGAGWKGGMTSLRFWKI